MAAQDSEDTSALRDALHELMADEVTEVLVSLLPQLPATISHYANKHAVENFNQAEQQRVDPPSQRQGNQQLPVFPSQRSN